MGTIPSLLVASVMLLAFHPVLRVAAWIGRRHEEREVSRLNRALLASLRMSRVRVEVEMSPNVEHDRGYVIIANHQSMFDIPLFLGYLPKNRVTFVSKKTLARGIPSVSFNLRYGGSALIDRDNPRQSLRAIKECGVLAEERNASVVIYPEGTRSRDGRLKEFRPAGTVTLLKAAPSLPVLPTTIDGSWVVFRNNLLPIPFGTRVRVRFGDPIERRSGEDLKALVQTARQEIAATLHSWRADS